MFIDDNIDILTAKDLNVIYSNFNYIITQTGDSKPDSPADIQMITALQKMSCLEWSYSINNSNNIVLNPPIADLAIFDGFRIELDLNVTITPDTKIDYNNSQYDIKIANVTINNNVDITGSTVLIYENNVFNIYPYGIDLSNIVSGKYLRLKDSTPYNNILTTTIHDTVKAYIHLTKFHIPPGMPKWRVSNINNLGSFGATVKIAYKANGKQEVCNFIIYTELYSSQSNTVSDGYMRIMHLSTESGITATLKMQRVVNSNTPDSIEYFLDIKQNGTPIVIDYFIIDNVIGSQLVFLQLDDDIAISTDNPNSLIDSNSIIAEDTDAILGHNIEYLYTSQNVVSDTFYKYSYRNTNTPTDDYWFILHLKSDTGLEIEEANRNGTKYIRMKLGSDTAWATWVRKTPELNSLVNSLKTYIRGGDNSLTLQDIKNQLDTINTTLLDIYDKDYVAKGGDSAKSLIVGTADDNSSDNTTVNLEYALSKFYKKSDVPSDPQPSDHIFWADNTQIAHKCVTDHTSDTRVYKRAALDVYDKSSYQIINNLFYDNASSPNRSKNTHGAYAYSLIMSEHTISISINNNARQFISGMHLPKRLSSISTTATNNGGYYRYTEGSDARRYPTETIPYIYTLDKVMWEYIETVKPDIDIVKRIDVVGLGRALLIHKYNGISLYGTGKTNDFISELSAPYYIDAYKIVADDINIGVLTISKKLYGLSFDLDNDTKPTFPIMSDATAMPQLIADNVSDYDTSINITTYVSDGNLYVRGTNTFGVGGTSSDEEITDWTQSSTAPSNITKVFCIDHHTYVLTDDNKMYVASSCDQPYLTKLDNRDTSFIDHTTALNNDGLAPNSIDVIAGIESATFIQQGDLVYAIMAEYGEIYGLDYTIPTDHYGLLMSDVLKVIQRSRYHVEIQLKNRSSIHILQGFYKYGEFKYSEGIVNIISGNNPLSIDETYSLYGKLTIDKKHVRIYSTQCKINGQWCVDRRTADSKGYIIKMPAKLLTQGH